jgi:hypothetical protein
MDSQALQSVIDGFANLTQTRVTWEEGTLIDMKRHGPLRGPGLYKKTDGAPPWPLLHILPLDYWLGFL